MLCKYALLHTSISCYTSTVTSIFHIAVCHTPCGVTINKDTCDLLYFQFSVLCLQDKFPVTWLHISCVCVCVCLSVSLGTVVRRDILFKELHLTETGTQSTEVPVVRFVCVPGKFTLWHRWGEGTVKGVTPVLYEKQRYQDCRWGERGEVTLSVQSETWCPFSSSGTNRKYPVTQTESSKSTFFFFFFCSSESMLGLNICLYSK